MFTFTRHGAGAKRKPKSVSSEETVLLIFSLIVVLIVAGSQYRNGIFTSATMLIQVLLAGIVAFGFWEPVADELDAYWQEGRMAGCEDCLALAGLFVIVLFGLRTGDQSHQHRAARFQSKGAANRRPGDWPGDGLLRLGLSDLRLADVAAR